MMIQPGLSVSLPTPGAVPIVARMKRVMASATIGTGIERAPSGCGSAGQDFVQDLSLTKGHGRAKPLQISRRPTEQDFMELDRLTHAG